MKCYVYILYSAAFDKYYIGQTQDIADRLSRHNGGQVKSTKAYKPWLLKFCLEKENRGEAMTLERTLKNLSKVRLIDFIARYTEDNSISK